MRRLVGAGVVIVALGLASSPARADEPAAGAPAPAAAPADPAAAAPTADPAATPAAAPPATEPPQAQSKRTAWPWVMLGTGLALVATSAVFAGLTLHEDDKREEAEQKLFGLTVNDPTYKDLNTEVENRKDRAASNRTTAIIFGTVGFLTIAGSILWWYVEGSASEPAKAATKPRISPSLAPGYAGASFGLNF